MILVRKFILVIFLAALMAGCSENSYDRSLILQHAADSLIIPAYRDFDQSVDSLYASARAFTQNPSVEQLGNLKAAWTQSVKSWKRAEVYNFGPVESLVLVTAIDRWPTSEQGIERSVEEYDGSDDYLIRIGSNRKGLPAIEYLLFHDEASVVLEEFRETKRKAYLIRLTEALTQHSSAILDEWNSSYREEFIRKSGNNADSGITLLANELGYILQKIKMEKLEIPFGMQTEGTPRLQMLESVYAHLSKELIRENLISARRTFNGGAGTGFDDYIEALGVESEKGTLLSEAINREYDNALRIVDSIDGSLKDAILTQKSTVRSLINSIQRLYVYNDVDMISQLGILTVYSDNDGD